MTTPDYSEPSSPLSSPPASPRLESVEVPSSPLSDLSSRSPTPPPGWGLATPPPSQDAGEGMPRPRKRRKLESKTRTTQYLDLIDDTAQSLYDRREALDTLLKALRKRRKIVVIAGAGISVNAGIPDFRSSHGLFSSLRGEHKLKGSGKQLFDASVYKDATSTSHFHDMVRKLSKMSKDAKPTAFHHLLARLSTEGRLLRLYTQNVDGLETQIPPLVTMVPLPHKGPWPQTVQLHGGLEKMTCQKCREIMDFDEDLFNGPDTPTCPKCRERDDFRTIDLGRRSHGVGRLRPRIVLYNEQNPDDEAIGAVSAADMRTRPDAIVVVGTSMKIPGVRRIVSEMCKIVRGRREGTTIWINPDPEPSGPLFDDCWDLVVKGTSDEVARRAKLRQWDDPVQDDYDTIQEDIDGEIEQIKAEQGETDGQLPPTPHKLKSEMLKAAAAAVMTPPRSQNGDVEPMRKMPTKKSPISIKLHVRDPQQPTEKTDSAADTKPEIPVQVPSKLKNPASDGRKISDVLGKENTIGKKGKARPPKSGLGKQQTKPTQAMQGKLMGKIGKGTKSRAEVCPPKKEPLSPSRDSEINVQRKQQQPAEFSSADPTPAPETPPFLPASPIPYDRQETISPKGNVPADLQRLLN